MSRKSSALTYPEPLGSPQPVVGDLYFTIKNVYRSSCKLSVILVRFCYNFNFLERFWKNVLILNFIEICLMRVQLFDADR